MKYYDHMVAMSYCVHGVTDLDKDGGNSLLTFKDDLKSAISQFSNNWDTL